MSQSELMRAVIGLAIIVGSWLLGWLFRSMVVGRLTALLRRSSTDLDDLVLAALRPHIPFWFLILGVVLGTRYFGLSPQVHQIVDRVAEVALILSVTLAVSMP